VEHRVAGADANPHMTLAAVLAAAHYGITHKIDPGPAVVGNGYAEPGNPAFKLPTNWFAAVDLFANSEVMKDYLGERFVRMYATVKQTEQSRFFDEIPVNDYDWYLRNA
jgi:glutamine synthetase